MPYRALFLWSALSAYCISDAVPCYGRLTPTCPRSATARAQRPEQQCLHTALSRRPSYLRAGHGATQVGSASRIACWRASFYCAGPVFPWGSYDLSVAIPFHVISPRYRPSARRSFCAPISGSIPSFSCGARLACRTPAVVPPRQSFWMNVPIFPTTQR